MRKFCAVFLFMLTVAGLSAAGTITWVDWQNQTAGLVAGSMGGITVIYTGAYSFAQVSGGTNYWNPDSPYISPTVPNAPPASDIIGIDTAGSRTFTFSQPVVDPVMAIVSLNGGNQYEFGAPVEVLSYGTGYWGGGTLFSTGTGVGSTGEGHGTIRIQGTFSSLTFTSTVAEGWNGFTIGYDASAVGGEVPEPGTLGTGVLVLLGALALRLARLRK